MTAEGEATKTAVYSSSGSSVADENGVAETGYSNGGKTTAVIDRRYRNIERT